MQYIKFPKSIYNTNFLFTVENLIGRGRKRTTNGYTDGRIVRESQRNPSITSRNIVETLKLNITRRKLKDVNLKSCLA